MRSVQLADVLLRAEPGFASGENVTDGVAQLRMNNVSTDGTLDWSEIRRVPANSRKVKKYALRPGDVVFNSTNSPDLVGKTALFSGFKEPAVFSNHFLRLCVNRDIVEPGYLAWWLFFRWKHRTFENLCTRWVNQASVRKDDLLDLQIELPDLSEQQRIVVRLEQADRLRRTRRYAVELTDTVLPAAFLELFGDPVANPKCWPIVSIDEVVERFESGINFNPVSDNAPASDWRVLKVSAVSTGDFLPEESKPISPDETFNDSLVVRRGDLIMSRANTVELVGAVCRVRENPSKVLLPDKLWRIRLSVAANVDPEFLLQCLCMPSIRHEISVVSSGTSGSMKNISKDDAGSIRIPLPPFPLQRKFARLAERVERLRSVQRESLRQVEHLFASLLHHAFAM
jgi:type I restriction enzyme S subunit